jgi:hypothetical protein
MFVFGSSVAVSGTVVMVGAFGGTVTTEGAFIYAKGTSGWPTKPTVSLKPPSGAQAFGASVAISGTTAVVGAPFTGSLNGSAFIYAKSASGWPTTPTATLTDPPANGNDDFGAVAISGNVIIVGAPGTNSNAGSAYIYVKRTSGWPLEPTATLKPPSGGDFGGSVAVSGTAAMVGAPGYISNVGSAYLYLKGTSGWPTKPTVTLKTPAGAGLIGASVAISGTTAVVGPAENNSNIRQAHLYLKGPSGWPTTPTATLTAPPGAGSFASSVAISGTTALIGAPDTNSTAGSAYIYRA